MADAADAALYTRAAQRKKVALNAHDRLSGTAREHSIPAPVIRRMWRAKKARDVCRLFLVVRSRRLDLPRVAPLAPQASASTVPPRPHRSGARRFSKLIAALEG